MVPGAAGAVELVGASAVESGAVVSGGAAPTVTLGSVMLVAPVVAAPSLPHAETSTSASRAKARRVSGMFGYGRPDGKLTSVGDQHEGDAQRKWGDLGGGFVSTHHR